MDIPTIYCESLTHVLQPINTISNIGHFAIAIFVFWYLFKKKVQNKLLYLLPVSILGISIGSTHWHYTSSAIGDLLDTIFIATFILTTSIVLLWKIFSRDIVRLIMLIVIAAGALYVEQLPHLNNSLIYLYFFILLVAGFLYLATTRTQKIYIFVATIIFFVAVFFRTIDMTICSSFIHGTHFIWHILMALVLGLLSVMVVKLTR